MRPLNGNSSDTEHLSAAVQEVMTQLREHLLEEHEQRIAVFDSGGYSQANMKSYHDANIWWISRVPETSTAAKSALEEVDGPWQPLSDGSGDYVVRTMDLPQGKERWVIVRTHAQVQATKEQMEKQGKKIQQEWEKRLCLRQEARARHCFEFRDGALLVGVSAGRTSAASPTGGNGTNPSQ